jgi:hypothetical protein
VPSTASFDRLLLSLLKPARGVILARNRPKSGKCRLKRDLTLRLGGMMVVAVGVILTALKLIH